MIIRVKQAHIALKITSALTLQCPVYALMVETTENVPGFNDNIIQLREIQVGLQLLPTAILKRMVIVIFSFC